MAKVGLYAFYTECQ